MTLPASEETVPATDMPERIYAAQSRGQCVVAFASSSMNYKVEYVRADLVLATREQAVRECAENGWQPIETAPRDGAPILAFGPEPVTSPDYGARETFWRFYGKGSIAYEQYQKGEGPSGAWHWGEPIHNWASSWKPTHWQPLPTPPLIERGSK